MLQKTKTLFILIAVFSLCTIGLARTPTLAASCAPNTSGCNCSSQGCDNGLPAQNPVDCASGKVDPTDASKCAPLGNGCNGNSTTTCLKNNTITTRLNEIVNFLSAGVGIIVSGVIILGGIQYSLAGDNPQALTAARQRIINGLIALLAFIFLFSFLQWLIPGGIFG